MERVTTITVRSKQEGKNSM